MGVVKSKGMHHATLLTLTKSSADIRVVSWPEEDSWSVTPFSVVMETSWLPEPRVRSCVHVPWTTICETTDPTPTDPTPTDIDIPIYNYFTMHLSHQSIYILASRRSTVSSPPPPPHYIPIHDPLNTFVWKLESNTLSNVSRLSSV